MKRTYLNQKSTVIDHVNITPVLDVMLTILVAFILIAPHLKHGIITDIPRAGGEALKEAESRMISIDREGKLFYEKKEVTLSELESELKLIGTGSSLYLEASGESQYGYFVEVLSLLKELGFENVNLATRPRGG